MKEISQDPTVHSYYFSQIDEIKRVHDNDDENYIGLSMEDFIAGLCVRAYKKGKEDATKS